MNDTVITITGKEQAALLTAEAPAPLGPNEVRGRTLVSLVSPGTELAWNYLGQGGQFPSTPGYAAIFEAEAIGSQIKNIKPGTHLLCMGGHRSLQQHTADSVVAVPEGLAPDKAVLARLMGVSMTTLMTTKARPGDIILITGAGPVGYLCAHLFKLAGYEVHVADPDAKRRTLAEASGIKHVTASATANDKIKGNVAMAIDCSGHEQAVLDGAAMVRKGGEVVLVGVPWKQHTDRTAHELLSLVFHQYVILRSGWEWELPHHSSDFRPHSIFDGYRHALNWLADGRIPCPECITHHQPENAQAVYQDLLHGKPEGLFHIFNWQAKAGVG